MIGNRGFSRFSGRSSFAAAIAYATRDDEAGEPARGVWSENVASLETAAIEMEAVAAGARGYGERLYHLILSWGPEERPSFEQARDATAFVAQRLGFEGLQMVAGLQDDGRSGMYHVHAVFNLVDLESGVVRSPWRDFPAIRAACREWERLDGWRELPDAQEPSRVTDDRYGTRKRFSEYVRREVAPEFRRMLEETRATWNGVRSWLHEHGITYEVVREHGARLVGRMSGWVARVSDLGVTHHELVERLGAWMDGRAEERAARDRAIAARVDAVREDVRNLPASATWNDVHAAFEAKGLEYRKHFAGARVVETEHAGWKRIDRDDDVLALRRLQERFGAYESSRAAEYRQQQREAVERLEDLVRGVRLANDPTPFMESLFATRSVVGLDDIERALARDVADAEQRAAVREAVGQRLLALERADGSLAFTTPAIAQEEDEAREAVLALASSRRHTPITRPAGERLDEQQRRAYEYVVADDTRVKVVTGVPGSGKTTLINELVEGFESAGYRVRGVSVANSAVDVLRRETSIPARSVAKELYEWGRAHEPPLSARDVLLVDEGSTLGTPQGRALAREVERAGATMVVLGDDKQFEAVARGSLLRIATETLGSQQVVDLERTRRQKTEWQRAATEAARKGMVREALDAYRDHGFMHEYATTAEARKALVLEWARLESAGTTTTVETYTNAERRELNYLLRAAHRALGRLEGADHTLDTMDGRTPYAVGERVTIRETIRDAELFNGSAATVRGIQGTVLELERRDGSRVSIDTREHPGVQHGYCSTEFREQGATREAELQFFTRQVNQRSVTVGISRHTDEYHGFFSRQEFRRGYDGLLDLAERNRSKELVRDHRERGRDRVERAFARSGEERIAVTRER